MATTARTEPVSLSAAITAAMNATIGVLTITGVFSAEVGGAITAAVAAWVIVVAMWVRRRVTPTARVSGPD